MRRNIRTSERERQAGGTPGSGIWSGFFLAHALPVALQAWLARHLSAAGWTGDGSQPASRTDWPPSFRDVSVLRRANSVEGPSQSCYVSVVKDTVLCEDLIKGT